LNQLDGFDTHAEVKVIMATNKIESLDPALIRPGRIDRKIEFPVPDLKTKHKIFQIHTAKMSLKEDVIFLLNSGSSHITYSNKGRSFRSRH
jgi:26S proteasome regulatory subunit T2